MNVCVRTVCYAVKIHAAFSSNITNREFCPQQNIQNINSSRIGLHGKYDSIFRTWINENLFFSLISSNWKPINLLLVGAKWRMYIFASLLFRLKKNRKEKDYFARLFPSQTNTDECDGYTETIFFISCVSAFPTEIINFIFVHLRNYIFDIEPFLTIN